MKQDGKENIQAEDIKDIIKSAQAGNEKAKNKLVQLLSNDSYMRVLSHYLYLNRLLEPDDVRSEFWLGVIMSLPKCNINIGNPLKYLIWQGLNRVKRALGNRIKKEIVVYCNECGYIGTILRYKKFYICRKCGSHNVDTQQRHIDYDTFSTIMNNDKIRHKPKPLINITVNADVENMHLHISITPTTLSLSQRETEVFERIMGGIDRDSSNNYLKEIAEELHISPQAVSQYLRKIRIKLEQLLTERMV